MPIVRAPNCRGALRIIAGERRWPSHPAGRTPISIPGGDPWTYGMNLPSPWALIEKFQREDSIRIERSYRAATSADGIRTDPSSRLRCCGQVRVELQCYYGLMALPDDVKLLLWNGGDLENGSSRGLCWVCRRTIRPAAARQVVAKV